MHGSEELAQRLRKALQATVPATLEQVRAEAVSLCPVDSGQLRGSLRVRMGESPDGAQDEVVADVPYAAAVELGTCGRPPQPYLLPALALARPKASAVLQRLLAGG